MKQISFSPSGITSTTLLASYQLSPADARLISVFVSRFITSRETVDFNFPSQRHTNDPEPLSFK